MEGLDRPLLDDTPGRGRRFYAIQENDDGTVDVYLSPVVCVYSTDLGVTEYDITVRVVRGVVPWPELEEDIRARFYSWWESGEEINL
ncbi:MAG: hypothetical protein IKK21_05060 [Clostridia bacterium]|nr:hypothetical protein [Clostridia bacterium]